MFCWYHRWIILDRAESKPKSGGVLKEYPGFTGSPKYFASITSKHPAFGEFIKLQKELLDNALQNDEGNINIPLTKYAEDKMCDRCGMHILKLQKEIKNYHNYLENSLKLKTEVETALKKYWDSKQEI